MGCEGHLLRLCKSGQILKYDWSMSVVKIKYLLDFEDLTVNSSLKNLSHN